MALVILGGMVAEARGSVGGIVFSRNAAGAYVRTRTVPINPGSARQQAVRFAVAQLATRWVETLTIAQRASWETYGENVLLPNPLGQMRNVGGLAHYVRSNAPRIGFSAGFLPIVDDAPTIFDLGTYTEPSCSLVNAATDDFQWAFDNTDAWAEEDDAAMMVFASKPQNQSVNFFKGPYRAAEAVLGSSTLTPTSPTVMDLPFPVEVDHRVFFRCNVTRADGRLATSFRTFCKVTT